MGPQMWELFHLHAQRNRQMPVYESCNLILANDLDPPILDLCLTFPNKLATRGQGLFIGPIHGVIAEEHGNERSVLFKARSHALLELFAVRFEKQIFPVSLAAGGE